MTGEVDLSPVRGCLCLAARRKARAITRMYDEYLRPHGLRSTQFSVLAALSQKGPTPVSELADLLGLERTSLTRSANLLERNGWIAVEPSRADARERLLELTDEGTAVLRGAFPSWQQAQQRAVAAEAAGQDAIGALDPGN